MSIKELLFDRIVAISEGSYKSLNSSESLKELLERGLIRRYDDTVLITEKGRQFLFQCNCEKTLKAMEDGKPAEVCEDITNWLLNHQFAIQLNSGEREWKVTPRGRDWLTQLE
jgi:predicted transcriptional regulator